MRSKVLFVATLLIGHFAVAGFTCEDGVLHGGDLEKVKVEITDGDISAELYMAGGLSSMVYASLQHAGEILQKISNNKPIVICSSPQEESDGFQVFTGFAKNIGGPKG